MPGGKGKSTGGKAGPKAPEGKSQKSHSAKAGLQVSCRTISKCQERRNALLSSNSSIKRVYEGNANILQCIHDALER